MENFLEKIKNWIKDFLNPSDEEVNDLSRKEWDVNPHDVISINMNGATLIGGVDFSPAEIKKLGEEAKYLSKTRLWSVMQNTIRQKAIEKSVLQSLNYEQVLSGKLMIHNLGIQKDILERIIRLST